MTKTPQRIDVRLGPRSYSIEIGRGTLDQAGAFLLARTKVTSALVITDSCVEPLYAGRVSQSLLAAGIWHKILTVPAGEPSKSVAMAERLWTELLESGADRNTQIVAVGGGVVGDLAGFVGATFARGLPLVQIPTTLLAQVDSSVGGKVGINLPGAKNIVGAFWQPCGVLIDPEVLTTLPEREYRAGLAEVVKYGVILDATFFAYLEQNHAALAARDPLVLEQVIARCCQLKADVVERDQHDELGLRAVLNYGHTFGHALETASGYGQLLHGEAVAIGMTYAARLAQRLGRVDAEFCRRQRTLLQTLGLPTAVPELSPRLLLDLMSRDKKVEHGRLRFVLPSRLGHVELVSQIDSADVQAALAE